MKVGVTLLPADFTFLAFGRWKFYDSCLCCYLFLFQLFVKTSALRFNLPDSENTMVDVEETYRGHG